VARAQGPPPLAPALHPTASSWTNLIERWFKELTDRMLKRGVFTSVPELETAILKWAAQWNNDPKPFVWKASAEDIIEKVRGRAALTRKINSATPLDRRGASMTLARGDRL
jgi:hypothetical protein